MTSKGSMVLGRGTMNDKEYYEWLVTHAGITLDKQTGIDKNSLIEGMILILRARLPVGNIFLSKASLDVLQTSGVEDLPIEHAWYGFPIKVLEGMPDGQILITANFHFVQTPEELKSSIAVINFQP